MKKLIVFLLLLILFPYVSYAQIWEGDGGQGIDEGIGFGGGGIDISDYDGATLDVTFINNVDSSSFTISGFPAGFPFSTLMDSIPESYLDKTGYTYSGVQNQPVVLPTDVQSVTYTLIYTADMYTIQYWSDANTDYATQTVAYNSVITPPTDPTYSTPNDFFYEWTDLPTRMPAQDIVVYADHGTDYYGFTLDASTGDVTYLADAVGKNPITVDQATVGNWTSNDPTSWKDFVYKIVRPCMLKMDGTVDYYLDRDDQTLKEDGTASDIGNFNYEGNAMVEFKRVYVSVSMNSSGVITVYLCRGKRDSSYTAEAFTKADGTVADRVYFAMFGGLLDNHSPQRMRSMATTTNSPSQSSNPQSSISKIENNGTGWRCAYYSLLSYINILHVLVGKSVSSQAVYGGGVCGVSSPLKEGSMAEQGCFWGTPTTSNAANANAGNVAEFKNHVKSFWIVNHWGNCLKYIQGIHGLSSNNTVYLKTRPPYQYPISTSDNPLDSTYDSYNSNGIYYLTVFNNCIIPTQKMNHPSGYPATMNSPISDFGTFAINNATTYAHYCHSGVYSNSGVAAGLWDHWFYYSFSGNGFISYRITYLN